MMIMASWIFAVASGWRPIACMAPSPMPPRPMPEPMAAMPMPRGRPSASADCRFMSDLLVSVGVPYFRLSRVLFVMLVRKHEEDVDGTENGEHQRLQDAAEQRQWEEHGVQRD